MRSCRWWRLSGLGWASPSLPWACMHCLLCVLSEKVPALSLASATLGDCAGVAHQALITVRLPCSHLVSLDWPAGD